MREKYESLSASVLRELAKSRGIKGTSTMKKAQLVEAMLALDESEAESKKAEEAAKSKTAAKAESEKTEKTEFLQPGRNDSFSGSVCAHAKLTDLPWQQRQKEAAWLIKKT